MSHDEPEYQIATEPGNESATAAMQSVYEEVCGAWATEMAKSVIPTPILKSVTQASERAFDSAFRSMPLEKILPVLSFERISPPDDSSNSRRGPGDHGSKDVREAEKILDREIKDSGMSSEQQTITKELEHAILEGNPENIAKGLKELDRLRQQGDEKSAKEIETRIANDFKRTGLDVHFSPDGSMSLSKGVPYGIVIEKDATCSTFFNSGLLFHEPEQERSPAEATGYDILSAINEKVNRIQDEARAKSELKNKGKAAAQEINRN